MKTDSKKAFLISSLLHAGFFLMLLAVSLIGMIRKPIPLHVFTLHTPPQAGQRIAVPVENETAVAFALPQIDPVVPPPRQIQRPVPDPQSVRPAESVKPISYEDFVRQHGAPREVVVAEPPPKAVEVRSINIDSIRETLRDANPAPPSRNDSRDGIMRYLGGLKARINQAWLKPASLSGRPFEAVVEFLVLSDGRLSEVRIVRSSGNEIFDASVRAAFSKVPGLGPTPDSNAYRPRLTFRMVE